MAYRMRIKVANPKPYPVTTTVYAGTVFEVIDPFARVQSLTPVRNVTATVQPGQSHIIEVESWCLNHRFSAPHDTPLRPTALRTYKSYQSQGELWADLDSR